MKYPLSKKELKKYKKYLISCIPHYRELFKKLEAGIYIPDKPITVTKFER